MKDILQRYKNKIRDVELIDKILHYISNITGSIISIKNISDTLQKEQYPKVSPVTIGTYINYLLQAYIIQKAQRYNIKGKKIFEHKDKYYFTDVGMRNSFGYEFKNDK